MVSNYGSILILLKEKLEDKSKRQLHLLSFAITLSACAFLLMVVQGNCPRHVLDTSLFHSISLLMLVILYNYISAGYLTWLFFYYYYYLIIIIIIIRDLQNSQAVIASTNCFSIILNDFWVNCFPKPNPGDVWMNKLMLLLVHPLTN